MAWNNKNYRYDGDVSVLQMIVSPTLNSLSQDLDLVERRFEWKATWGMLEIKIYVVGMEYLGLNT